MDDGSPSLEVGFAIEAGGSFDILEQVQRAMDTTEARVVRDAASIEQATGGMVNIGDAVAQITSFGNAASRELQQVAKEAARVEKSGEALVRQLERQNAAYGLTREELRGVRVEEQALAAERVGNTDLAQRLRDTEAALRAKEFAAARAARIEAENAAEDKQREADIAERAAARKAQALMQETAAAAKLAREHAELAALVRGSAAAQEADAVAAERLRMSTDPLYAATKRLNDEIAESTRLYHAGMTAPEEYARQQAVLQQRLKQTTAAHDMMQGALVKNGRSLTQFSFQLNDIATMAALGAPPLQILASQGGQIIQIFQMAEGGAGAFARQLGALAIAGAPVAAVIAVAGVAIWRFKEGINDDAQLKKYAEGLGLTRDEMKKLGDVSVTTGDLLKGLWTTIQDRLNFKFDGKKIIDYLFAPDDAQQVGNFIAEIYGLFVGGYKGVVAAWGMLPRALGDLYAQAVGVATDAIEKLVNKAIGGVNWFARQANAIFGTSFGQIDAIALGRMGNAYEGAARDVVETFTGAIRAEKVRAQSAMTGFFSDVGKNAAQSARNRIKAEADKIIGDRSDGRSAAQGLNDQQKAFEAATKAANDYIAAQIKLATNLGLSAKQIRLLEDAAARAAAPTDALKAKIDEAAAAREAAYSRKSATDFDANVMQPLRDELALYGLIGPARAQAALELEKQAFIAKNMDDGIAVATARWQEYYRIKSELIAKDEAADREAKRIRDLAESLRLTSERADEVADAMSRAFGRVGSAIGDVISILGRYGEEQDKIDKLVQAGTYTQAQGAKRSADLQMNSLIGITGAAKNLFKEHSKGYQAMAAAEKALTILQLARTAVDVAGGAARMFAQLGPFAFPAVAAMLGVMASLGFGGGSGVSSEDYTKGNTGTGTVLGDSDAKSDSIKRAIDSLKEVDTLTNNYAREMAASLRSIDSQIGNVASLVVRAGDINASAGVNTGFNTSTTGSVLKNLVTGGGLISSIPIIGGIAGAIGSVISSLFGTKTTVVGSGLYGADQSLGSILSGGFDASYYSDIQKKKKFLGITTSTKYSTQYAAADPTLENQFTLILRSFSDAISAAAGPLGVATTDIQQRLNSFVVSIGKIDLKGLTGEEIQDKLTAVFGAAADKMANAAFPGIERFQKVGEGAFETLVRVASTVEAVTNSIGMLGSSVQGLSIDAKLGLADLFDSVGDLTSAVSDYFERFYTQEEQVAAQTDQLQRVFTSLGLVLPDSLASFRALVEAQNLNTEAGRATYAMLLQLAPAFADLQQAMNGARSAADIMSERQDLQRKLLELQGDTAAIRALDLAKIDISNRALQEQIWAIQDAQDAAKAADDLRKAWTDVGTSIMDEVKRIRGLADPTGNGSFASIMGQFNAATAAARGGDQDAAKSLPGLSQALLQAASDAATSRQELERVQAQTAASLEATYAAISTLMSPSGGASTADALLAAMSSTQANAAASTTANDNLVSEIEALREEVAALRADNNAGHAATAGNTGRIAKTLDNVTQPNGGDAISVASAA